ncbi:hypothetical protein [Halotia branconii]|uniref:Uncharacterized protein n=1 Tax=Halotia branconii CENA392 TaxID=1539056 RepID=A0AAJ6NW27_9CYAN|nr:hypothetical protein [Halotia branconii]WGV27534.1 hypothetical protein QI031_08615 [Halotia branconii CENA392]
MRRFSLKHYVDAQLNLNNFRVYIEYLNQPFNYTLQEQELKQLYDVYQRRAFKSGDIKALYKTLFIDVICENKETSIRDKLFKLFEEGFSTNEHLTKTYGEFANVR